MRRLTLCLAAAVVPFSSARAQAPGADLRRLLAVDTMLSPIDWMKTHIGDVRRVQSDGCVSAVGNVRRADVTIRHEAVFDTPAVPRDYSLTSDTTRFGSRQCRLRYVMVQVIPRDASRAKTVADSVARLLGTGPADWSDTPGRISRQRDGFYAFGRADAHAALGDYGLARRRMIALLDSTLTWAGLPFELRPVISLAEAAGHDTIVAPATDTAVLRAVRQLTDSTTQRSPAARAAALLSADLLFDLAASEVYNGTTNEQRVRILSRIDAYEHSGAEFWHDEPDATMLYAHPWRRAAYAADPKSPAGQAALLGALMQGDNIDSTTMGLVKPRIVIALGERALAEHAADTAMVHLALAQAYADMYAVAHGFYGDMTDSTEYARDFPDARSRAVAHARAALASLRDPTRRAQAWVVAFDAIVGRVRALYYPFIND